MNPEEKDTFKEKAVKELLTLPPADECCKRAFLSAAAKQAGTINIIRRRMSLTLALASYQECLFVVDMLKSIYPADFEISMEYIRSGPKKGSTSYSVGIPGGFTKQFLIDTGLIRPDGDFEGFEEEVPADFANDRICAASYLKGLFLVCGSVYVPSMQADGEKKDGYHFEFSLDEEAFANSVARMVTEQGLPVKISERGNKILVYQKDKDEILGTLAFMGLADSVLVLKSIIDERETANSINRVAICEAANLDKTFAAASRQLMAIGLIEEEIGLENLTPALRETAVARLEYQQLSLSELSAALGISKSCLNHRLRKLTEIAENYENDQNQR